MTIPESTSQTTTLNATAAAALIERLATALQGMRNFYAEAIDEEDAQETGVHERAAAALADYARRPRTDPVVDAGQALSDSLQTAVAWIDAHRQPAEVRGVQLVEDAHRAIVAFDTATADVPPGPLVNPLVTALRSVRPMMPDGPHMSAWQADVRAVAKTLPNPRAFLEEVFAADPPAR